MVKNLERSELPRRGFSPRTAVRERLSPANRPCNRKPERPNHRVPRIKAQRKLREDLSLAALLVKTWPGTLGIVAAVLKAPVEEGTGY